MITNIIIKMKILNIFDTLLNYNLIQRQPQIILSSKQSALIIRNLILTEKYDVLNFKDIDAITESWSFVVYGSIELDLKIKCYNDQILRVLNSTRLYYNKLKNTEK